MQQGLAIEAKTGLIVRVITVGFFIQGDKEGSTFNGIQRSPVLARAKEGLTCLCPLYPGGGYKGG